MNWYEIALGVVLVVVSVLIIVFTLAQEQKGQGVQLCHDFFQALAAEVANLHHFVLALADQIFHRVDTGTLQAEQERIVQTVTDLLGKLDNIIAEL